MFQVSQSWPDKNWWSETTTGRGPNKHPGISAGNPWKSCSQGVCKPGRWNFIRTATLLQVSPVSGQIKVLYHQSTFYQRIWWKSERKGHGSIQLKVAWYAKRGKRKKTYKSKKPITDSYLEVSEIELKRATFWESFGIIQI